MSLRDILMSVWGHTKKYYSILRNFHKKRISKDKVKSVVGSRSWTAYGWYFWTGGKVLKWLWWFLYNCKFTKSHLTVDRNFMIGILQLMIMFCIKVGSRRSLILIEIGFADTPWSITIDVEFGISFYCGVGAWGPPHHYQNWNSGFSCRVCWTVIWFLKEPGVHMFCFLILGSLPWAHHHSSRKSWEQTDHTSIWFLWWVFKEIRKCKCLEIFHRSFWLSSSYSLGGWAGM